LTLLVLALARVGLYFYRAFDGDMDVLAIASVACIAVAAFKDVRYLLVGWFIVSPYFLPTAMEGSSNIASNFGHNYFVPVNRRRDNTILSVPWPKCGLCVRISMLG
jgi:hypothetical protein